MVYLFNLLLIFLVAITTEDYARQWDPSCDLQVT